MGEAKRKAALSAGLVLSPDQQADVARLVRAIAFDVGRGGACLFRAVVGQAALAALGHPSTIVFGGMLYRAGPDELVDTVAFCGPGNAALLMARQMLGHYWLQAGRDLIDFTVGDWPQQNLPDVYDIHRPSADVLPPIRWHVQSPDFWWRPAADLIAPWRAQGTPALGQAWYQPAPAYAALVAPGCRRCAPTLPYSFLWRVCARGRRVWPRPGGGARPHRLPYRST